MKNEKRKMKNEKWKTNTLKMSELVQPFLLEWKRWKFWLYSIEAEQNVPHKNYINGSRIPIMLLNDMCAEAYWSTLVGLVFSDASPKQFSSDTLIPARSTDTKSKR